MHAQKGFTLIEVVIAMTVLVLAVLAISSLFDTSSESLEYFTNVASAESAMGRTLDLIADDVQQSTAGGILITPAAGHDAVTISRSWGENATATVRYVVGQDGELIRTIELPDASSTTTVIARCVDELDSQGFKGFRVVEVGTGGLYTISLRVNVPLHAGEILKRTFTTAARPRS